MKIGTKVKFKDGLYPDEEGAYYRVVEDNGSRVILEFICDLPLPPQSIALVEQLEEVETIVVDPKADKTRNERQARRRKREKEWLAENGWVSWEAFHTALLRGQVGVVSPWQRRNRIRTENNVSTDIS